MPEIKLKLQDKLDIAFYIYNNKWRVTPKELMEATGLPQSTLSTAFCKAWIKLHKDKDIT